MARKSDFKVGPVIRAANTYEDALRVNEDGALVTSDGHSSFYEPASRGNTYTVSTVLTGTGVVAVNVAPPAAGSATILSVLNPVGSGVNLEILKGWIYHISTGVGGTNAGFWAWCASGSGNGIVTAESGVKRPLRVGQRVSKVKAWSQTVLTGGKVHTIVRPFPCALFTGVALAGTTWDLATIDNVDGALTVPPGWLLTLAPAGRIVNDTVGAGIQYAEVPLPQGPDGSNPATGTGTG